MPPRQIDPDVLRECCVELAARRANAGNWRPGARRPPTCFLRVGEALGCLDNVSWLSAVEVYVAAWAIDQIANEIPAPARAAMTPEPYEGSLDWDDTTDD